jgi:transposase
MSFQGKAFTPEMKQFVRNLKRHFDTEKRLGKYVSTKNAVTRVAKGLDIGEATVKRIMADSTRTHALRPPSVRGKPPYRVAQHFQPMLRTFVREKNLQGQKIRVDDIQDYLFKEHHIEVPHTTLLYTLKRFGFTYGQGKCHSAVKEHPRIILARRRYLRRKRANRNPDGTLKQPEVYLDETFLNTHHSYGRTWYFEDDGPWVNKPIGKGPRRIIVSAITQAGWVDGAQLVFDSKRRTGDYHGQMNWDNFSRWVTTQLLPNIPAHSLIILDNAPYHNALVDDAFPTQRTLKKDLCEWLEHNGIPWTEDMLKPELFELCQRLATRPEFKLDQLLKPAGHTALRTPPYHPELQPIETCWAVVKNYMADQCDFTMETFTNELPKAFEKVTTETCQKVITLVVEQEEKYWIEDSTLYDNDEDMFDEEIEKIVED